MHIPQACRESVPLIYICKLGLEKDLACVNVDPTCTSTDDVHV